MSSATEEIPRRVHALVDRSLSDTPVVIVEGARQVGKSTLAGQIVASRGGRILTLDDEDVLAAARFDPAALVASRGDGLLVVDEVQLAPQLLRAVKAAVDRNRTPGSFLLTGSANLLTMPGAQENLAGRAETIPLYGFSQGELRGTSDSLGEALLSGDESRVATRHSTLSRSDYLALVEAGSYPEALNRPAGRRRSAWFDNYANRMVSRDARQVSALTRLDRLPLLLRVLAANTSGELVKARIAADVGLPETTLPPYLSLLESLYLIHLLPPWGRNLRRRVVGRPKLALLDSGLACRLGGLSAAAMDIGSPDAARAGALLETFVAGELCKQSRWAADPFGVFHYRERTGVEVDLVLETATRRIAGVEVKASSSVDPRDFRALNRLAELAGVGFAMGAVLYTGQHALRFGPRLWALPVASLWQ